MDDQGFHFQPESPRREARKFEPPPWEKDLSEQPAREQSEQAMPGVEPSGGDTADRKWEAQTAPPAARAAEVSNQVRRGTASGEGPAVAPAEKPVDEQMVARMLIELRAEEPAGLEGAWVVNAAAGFVLVLVGIMAGIWSATALAKPGMGTIGFLAALSLLALGLGFLGVGVWLVVKALRQQGVL